MLCFTHFPDLENNKRDRKTGLEGASADETGYMNFADMTDKEMRNFRYVY